MAEEQETGINHGVSVLHMFLCKWTHSSLLPREMFVQLDICTRKNKNRYIFGFIETLDLSNIFDLVEVQILLITHVREYIDQLFSTLSKIPNIRQNIILTEIHHELCQIYKIAYVSCLKRVAKLGWSIWESRMLHKTLWVLAF